MSLDSLHPAVPTFSRNTGAAGPKCKVQKRFQAFLKQEPKGSSLLRCFI